MKSSAILLSFVFAFSLAACVTTTPKSEKISPFAPAPDPNAPPPKDLPVVHKPWTARFMQPCSLLAAEIRIEGPEGLLDHLAVRQELELQEVEQHTTPDGLLQTITLKPGIQGAEIHVHIDNLSIVALRRVTILERVQPCDVLVTGAGDAYWKEKASGREERSESVRIEGRIERPAPR